MQTTQDEISLKDLMIKIRDWFHYFKSKWLILVLATLIGGVSGVVYAVTQKASFIAHLSFVLEDEKGSSGIGGALGLASQFGFDLGVSGGGAFSESNLMELMQSRNLIEKVLLTPITTNGKEMSLANYYLRNKKDKQKRDLDPTISNIVFPPNPNRDKFTRLQDSILGVLYTEVNHQVHILQKDKKISILTIEVKTADEFFAKEFAERLADVVSDFYIQTKSKKARLNVSILEKQVDSIRGELNGAINRVATATDNTYNLNPALNIKRVPSTQKQVDVQANTVILTQLVANLELAKVTLRKETPLIQIIDKPILPLDIDKMSKRKTAMSGGLLAFFIAMVSLLGIRVWKNINAA